MCKGDDLISTYLPITVVVTCVLFCFREVLDLIKKHREKKRLIETLKLLISEELRDNYYALDSLYNVLKKIDTILKANEKNILVQKAINTDRFGNDKVSIRIGENGEYGLLYMPFPRFSTKRYESYVKDIASLDLALYKKITESYKELRYCEKIRCEVIEYLESEHGYMEWAFDYRVNFMLEQKEKYLSLMQSLHESLTGNHMKIERSEVVETELEKNR